MRIRIVVATFLSIFVPPLLRADIASSTITLNLSDGTISPGSPTINISANPSVDIRVSPATCTCRLVPDYAPPGPPVAALRTNALLDQLIKLHAPAATILSPTQVASLRTALNALHSTYTTQITSLKNMSRSLKAHPAHPLNVKDIKPYLNDQLNVDAAKPPTAEQVAQATTNVATQLDNAQKNQADVIAADQHLNNTVAATADATDGSAMALNFHSKSKKEQATGHDVPLAAQANTFGTAWDVNLLNERADYVVTVVVTGADADCANKNGHTYSVVIHVDSAPFELNWSLGIAVSTLWNQTLRLDPITNSTNLAIVESGHSSPPSNLVALAHYCTTDIKWLCFTSGLGTDLPSTGVLVLFGPSYRFRPLADLNSFYITAGAVYGPHQILSSDYAGRTSPTVPPGTTTSTLLTTSYKVGFAVSLSYGFLNGAQDKFASVFSSNNSASSPAPSSSQPKPPSDQTQGQGQGNPPAPPNPAPPNPAPPANPPAPANPPTPANPPVQPTPPSNPTP